MTKKLPFEYAEAPRNEAPVHKVPDAYTVLASKIQSPESLRDVKRAIPTILDYCSGGDPSKWARLSYPEAIAPQFGDSASAAFRIASKQDGVDSAQGVANQYTKESIRWWAEREMLRLHLGVYARLTSTLQDVVSMFYLQPYFIHISSQDPTKLAYTPDAEMGKADRQVTVAPGKLFRKLLPLVSDNYIAALESCFRSETCATYYLTSDPAGIEHVYRNMMGDSGCMRYEPAYFGVDTHPSRAYAAPGFSVAFTLDGDNNIKSRAVCWVDPTNPRDKRYVRVYGDAVLGRMLERDGYECKALYGAKLVAIPRHEDDDPGYYVVPYLDGPAGRQGEEDGAFGFVLQTDPGFIKLFKKTAAVKLAQHKGVSTVKFKSTNAKYYVPTIDNEDLTAVCCLTGQTFSVLENKGTIRVLMADGTVGTALLTSLEARTPNPVPVTTITKMGNTERVFAADDEALKHTFIPPGYGHRWTRTPEVINYMGLKTLDPRYYSADTLERSDATVSIVPWEHALEDTYTLNDEVTFIRCEDAYMLLARYPDSGQTRRPVHRSHVPELRKSGKWVTCSSWDGFKTLAHVDHPSLVRRTDMDRYAVIGVHAVRKTYDGRIITSNKTTTRRLWGIEFVVAMDDVGFSYDKVAKLWDQQFRSLYSDIGPMTEDMLTPLLGAFIGGRSTVKAHADFARDRRSIYGAEGVETYRNSVRGKLCTWVVNTLDRGGPSDCSVRWADEAKSAVYAISVRRTASLPGYDDMLARANFVIGMGEDAANSSLGAAHWQWAQLIVKYDADIQATLAAIDAVRQEPDPNPTAEDLIAEVDEVLTPTRTASTTRDPLWVSVSTETI